jgi:hypothetical protein
MNFLKFIALGLFIAIPVLANAQTAPTCGDAQTYFNSGNTEPLVSYAQQVWEQWNDSATSGGQPAVDFPDTQSNLDYNISMWKVACQGLPDKLFEDAVRTSYEMTRGMNNLATHPFGNN